MLLMDEPLGALDALTRETMQELILKVWRDDRQDGLLHHPRRRGGAVHGDQADRHVAAPWPDHADFDLDFCHRFFETGDAREVKSDARLHRDARGGAQHHLQRRARGGRWRALATTLKAGGQLGQLFKPAPAKPGEAYGAARPGRSALISVVTVVALFVLWWLVTTSG